MEQSVLNISGLAKRFGGVQAVSDVSFFAGNGVVTSIIGPNGAGKTTLVNLITGVLPADAGSLSLCGRNIANLPAFERARLGIARTYQTPQFSPGMSVMKNVMAGAYRFGRFGVFTSMLMPWKVVAENDALALRATACLNRVGVPQNLWHLPANELPYGHQRRVEIARALAQDPAVLLLDEPAAGLNPSETLELSRLLASIARDGRAVLLVEHDMGMVMSISSHIVVINFGRKLFEGTPKEVSKNPDVISAYLGADEEEVPDV